MLKFHADEGNYRVLFVHGKKMAPKIHDVASGEANIYLFSGINFPASAIARNT